MKRFFLIVYIIIGTMVNCDLFQKQMYIVNTNGVLADVIGKPTTIAIQFGQKIYIKEKINNLYWKAYINQGEYFSISELDFGANLPEFVYIKKIRGFKTEDNKIIPFREKVKLDKVEKTDEKSIVKIKYQDKIYASNPDEFSNILPFMYFFVTDKSGLNLREGPGQNFKKILTLPYKSTGMILSSNQEIFTIQKQTGFWMQVEYEQKTGWLFSGFIVMSDNKDWQPPSFSMTDSETGENDTSGDDFNFQPINDDGISNSKRINPRFSFNKTKISFEANIKDSQNTDSCSSEPENSLRLKSPIWDMTISLYEMQLEKEKSIGAGFIFYSGRGCNCCCALKESKLLAITNEFPQSFEYTAGSEASCAANEGTFLIPVSYLQFKVDLSSNTMYILRELPICAKKKDIDENQPKDGSYNIFEKLGSKGYFYIFKNNNGLLKTEKIETEPNIIPEVWKEKWEKAISL